MQVTFIIDKILFWLIKIMVFIIPLFFLPFASWQLGMDNYSKYFLLGIMTCILLLLFLFRQSREKNLKFYRSPLDLLILLLLLTSFISSLGGANKFVSFFGNLSNINLPFFSLLFFSCLYFLFFNLFDSKDKIISIFRIYVLSFLFLIPMMFVIVFSYNPASIFTYIHLSVGSFEDISLYLVYFIVFSLSLLSSQQVENKMLLNKKIRLVYNVVIFLAVVLVIRIDFFYAWWMLLWGMILVLFIRLTFFKIKTDPVLVTSVQQEAKAKKKKKKILVPIILIFISINFLLNFYLVLGRDSLDGRLVQNRQLNNTASLLIAKEVLTSSKLFFGLGSENFDYAYSKYRTTEMNNDKYWNLRYNKAGSLFTSLLIGGGAFGILMVLFIVSLILYYCLKVVALFKTKQEKEISFILIPVIIVLISSSFFYSMTASSLFLFVLLLAVFMRMSVFGTNTILNNSKLFFSGVCEFNYKNNKNKELGVYFLLGIFLIFCIVFLVSSFKFLLADKKVTYKNAKEINLLQAVKLSPSRYQYQLDLANLFANKARLNMKKGDPEAVIQDQKQSMEHLRLALELGENSVVVQETAAMIYRDFSETNDNNNQLAIKAFTRALTLEPSNPVISTELGKAWLRAGDYEQASLYLRKALNLKNDYQPAKLALAKSLAKEGNSEEALSILEKLAQESKDSNVYYELGLLYFNEDRIDKAQTAFSTAVTLSPLYSNALFGLALTLEKTGEIKQSLYYLRKIQRLNPANIEVGDKIRKLEGQK